MDGDGEMHKLDFDFSNQYNHPIVEKEL